MYSLVVSLNWHVRCRLMCHSWPAAWYPWQPIFMSSLPYLSPDMLLSHQDFYGNLQGNWQTTAGVSLHYNCVQEACGADAVNAAVD